MEENRIIVKNSPGSSVLFMEILKLVDPIPIQKGQFFISKCGLLVISNDLKQLSLFSSKKTKKFDLVDIKLKCEDRILLIDMIEKNVLFIYAIKNEKQIAFLKYFTKNSPQTLTFALDSFYFHRQILYSFSPQKGCFCIVSKQGITLHKLNMQVVFSIIRSIDFCLCSDEFLYISDSERTSILQFNEDFSSTLVYDTNRHISNFPDYFLNFSSFLLLIDKDEIGQTFTVKKISIYEKNIQSIQSLQKIVHFETDNEYELFKFMKFDDALLVVNSLNGSSSFIDFSDDTYYTLIGSEFTLNKTIQNTFCNNLAICYENKEKSNNSLYIYTIVQNYAAIQSLSIHLTAALFRRTNGYHQASLLLKELLNHESSPSKLLKLIETASPSASDPVSQLRFVKAIQFCGISNPHLILLCLLKFLIVLGDKAIDEAYIPFFEVANHPQCKHSIKSLISTGAIKINQSILQKLLSHNDLNNSFFFLDLDTCDNILDYAAVYIKNQKYDEAKKLILRAQIDGSYSNERIKQLIAQIPD